MLSDPRLLLKAKLTLANKNKFKLRGCKVNHNLQDDDWGTPAEQKPSSGSQKRRHEAPVATAAAAPGASQERVDSVAAAAAAPAAEALAADEAPAEKRQKVHAMHLPASADVASAGEDNHDPGSRFRMKHLCTQWQHDHVCSACMD